MPETVVVKDKARLAEFVQLPDIIYAQDPNWVKPLVGASPAEFFRNSNPALRYHEMELYLLSDATAFTGRIAAFVDHRYNTIHKEKTAFFGFFECPDNLFAAEQLFSAVNRFAQTKGMTRIIGPVEFTTNYQAGLLVDGFTRPTVMTPYNKPYYQHLVEANGFQKLIDLYAYSLENVTLPPRMKRMADIQAKRTPGISILSFKEAAGMCSPAIITNLYNAAFSSNWGYVPMSKVEFSHLLNSLNTFNHADFNYMAFSGRTPIGLLLTIPDIYAANKGQLEDYSGLKYLRVTVLGVLPAYRKRGVETQLGIRCLSDAVKQGYEKLEFSFIMENNLAMNNYINRQFGLPVSKTFRIYEKPVKQEN